MTSLLYRLATVAGGMVVLTSCAKMELSDLRPSADTVTSMTGERTAEAAVAPINFSYIEYTNLPEPMTYVTGQRYRYNTAGTTYRYPYTLGTADVPGGHTIYSFQPSFTPRNPTVGTWNVVAGPNGGGALKIALGQDQNYVGYFFAIVAPPANNLDRTSRLWSNIYPGGWTNTGIAASDVTLGYSASGSPIVYYLGMPPLSSSSAAIYRLNGATPVQISPGTTATSLALDGYGHLWITDANNQIFVNDNPSSGGSFAQAPGVARSISSDGPTVTMLSTARLVAGGLEVYSRNASDPLTQAWQLQPKRAVAIGNNAANDYFIIDADAALYLATYY